MKKIIPFSLLLLFLASCGKKKQETSVVRKDISELVFASGVLEPDSSYNLTAQTDGYLVSLSAREGDLVAAGALVALIDNRANLINEQSAGQLLAIANQNASDNGPMLKQAAQNLQIATEKYRQDSTQQQRYSRLFAAGSISRLELENSRLAAESSRLAMLNSQQAYTSLKLQAEQQLVSQDAMKKINSVFSGNNELRAVFGGKIYRRYKEAGDYVRKGDVIVRIGSASRLYAKVSVDETNIAMVKNGQHATLELNTDRGHMLKGEVYEILPAFDESSQSFTVKIRFDELPAQAISGTQLQSNIETGSKKGVLVIPRDYLGYGNKVIVKGQDEPVVVRTGFVSGEWVEIISGLKEGDLIQYEIE